MKVPSPTAPPKADDHVGSVPQSSVSPASTTEMALPCLDEATLERLSRNRVDSNPFDAPEKTQALSGMTSAQAVRRTPYLVVLTGSHEGKVIKLPTSGSFTIGRSDTCELVLNEDGISRKHARIVVSNGSAYVEDLESRNGTFTGPQKITRQALLGDEIIRVGARSVLKFSLMDEVEEDYLRRLLSAALTDPLTSLYNRRHFDECLATACARANLHKQVFSLAVIDVDNFKKVNDVYGHAVGDLALRKVGELLLQGARREDSAFRYGGEEFVVLMRNTSGAGAADVAEGRRKAIEDAVVQSEGVSLRITASFGVAQYQPGDSELQLFERADKALYAAKHSGKNRIVVAG